ncbi:hypothetical protein K505DRAFT_227098 [Melanomma pulvis-pyrius CBS 109.77]|uniref:Zn(2)-C6 fungal-type domain-containing protein n=1 Tax=Melanomma pulvis-pyrius CBS 109.77 TaxID=1314802 RepID=A0A6A6XZW7_9PLEO|nr:hypothetical protein K505DRAFT_227098 [Melanomma pulvis-pyrius CBS 109.77]
MASAADKEAEPKSSKRQCVQAACAPCRKRKSKCDGESPLCATCGLHKTACYYDAESDRRRTATTSTPSTTSAAIAGRKRPDPTPVHERERDGDAVFIVNALRSLPESDAHELLLHIRQHQHHPLDLAALAETWQKTATLCPSTPLGPPTLETDLAVLLGKPAVTQSGVSRHFGHTSSLGLVDEDENYTRSRVRAPGSECTLGPGTWTAVTQDVAFIERLFGLYFQWSHAFYIVFSRDHFLADFYSGREKYCSPLLVNVILAYACHFSDEPQARTEPNSSRTAGDHFFAEALKLLHEDESPSLTTTQALCVMALREPSAGRDSSGFMYMGRCIRMAVELGLHVNNSASSALGLTREEVVVRKVTFWGSFCLDSVWSICIGRISQLPKAAITLDKPVPDESAEGAQVNHAFLQQFSVLSELINDNNYMFFAPKERFTSRRLLDCYYKYLDWYKHLPLQLHLQSSPSPQPEIFMLHMLYHTLLVHLFRPMLKVNLVHSDVRPRDICIESANTVSELLRLYRKQYGMRACHLIMAHFLLSITVVHLLYSTDNQTSSRNLVEGLQDLEDLSVCHYFAARTFKIIYALSKTWNLPWPKELRNSRLLSKDNGSSASRPAGTLLVQPAPSTSQQLIINACNRLPSQASHIQRESVDMSGVEQPNMSIPAAYSSHHLNTTTTNPRSHLSFSNSTLLDQPSSSATSIPQINVASASNPTNVLFFNVPGMGAPIYLPNHSSSPMDLDRMLGNVDDWERLQRDGFKISDAWAQDLTIIGGIGNENGNGNGNAGWLQAFWEGDQLGGASVG